MFGDSDQVHAAPVLARTGARSRFGGLAVAREQVAREDLAAQQAVEDDQRVGAEVFVSDDGERMAHSTSSR